MSRPRRTGRYEKPPTAFSRKRVRTILVEDAVKGVETPVGWALMAYVFLGRGTAEGSEQAYVSVRQEVASLGATMPGAPGQ